MYRNEQSKDLLDALGIREISRDELMLKPEVFNVERLKRGEKPLEL